MVAITLAKSAVEPAQSHVQAVELWDALVPGVQYKVAPTGCKVFMFQYRANAGGRCTPALGLFGELTVEPARSHRRGCAGAPKWRLERRREQPVAPHDRGTVQEVHRGSPQATQQAQHPSRLPEVHQKQHLFDAGRMKVQDLKHPRIGRGNCESLLCSGWAASA